MRKTKFSNFSFSISNHCLVLATIALLSVPTTGAVEAFVLEPIIRAGDSVPGRDGQVFANFSGVSLNASGRVAFRADLTGGNSTRGIFFTSNGTAVPIALRGQVAPGTDGATFDTFSVPLINQTGNVAFMAGLQESKTRSGIFLFSSGRIIPVVLLHQVLPASGIVIMGFENIAFSDSNTLVFIARTYTKTGGNAQGIFLFSNGTISPLALPGQTTQDGVILSSPDSPSINQDDAVTFVNKIFIGPRGLSTGGGILQASGGTLSVIVALGQKAPSPATGIPTALFSRSISRPAINNSGSIAFISGLGSENGDSTTGVFLFGGGKLTQAVVGAQTAPVAGGTFDDFSEISLSDSGSLAFLATINKAKINDAHKLLQRGLFLFSGRGVFKIALEGDAAPPATGGTFSDVSRLAFKNGVLVFVGNLSGGKTQSAIFLARLQ